MSGERVAPAVGEALRRLRQRRQWTLRDVAERTGLHLQTVHRYEVAAMRPSVRRLRLICDALGATSQERSELLALLGWR